MANSQLAEISNSHKMAKMAQVVTLRVDTIVHKCRSDETMCVSNVLYVARLPIDHVDIVQVVC